MKSHDFPYHHPREKIHMKRLKICESGTTNINTQFHSAKAFPTPPFYILPRNCNAISTFWILKIDRLQTYCFISIMLSWGCSAPNLVSLVEKETLRNSAIDVLLHFANVARTVQDFETWWWPFEIWIWRARANDAETKKILYAIWDQIASLKMLFIKSNC